MQVWAFVCWLFAAVYIGLHMPATGYCNGGKPIASFLVGAIWPMAAMLNASAVMAGHDLVVAPCKSPVE